MCESFKERFELALKNSPFNKAQLAKRIGIDRSLLSQITSEHAHMPTKPIIIAMSKVLKCSEEWLINNEGQMIPDSITIYREEEKNLILAFNAIPQCAQRNMYMAIKHISDAIRASSTTEKDIRDL